MCIRGLPEAKLVCRLRLGYAPSAKRVNVNHGGAWVRWGPIPGQLSDRITLQTQRLPADSHSALLGTPVSNLDLGFPLIVSRHSRRSVAMPAWSCAVFVPSASPSWDRGLAGPCEDLFLSRCITSPARGVRRCHAKADQAEPGAWKAYGGSGGVLFCVIVAPCVTEQHRKSVGGGGAAGGEGG